MSGDEEEFAPQQDGELVPSRDGSVDETMEEGGGIADGQENGGHAAAEECGAGTTGTETSSYGTKVGTRGDDDDKKIFVGGLHWETTAADLREYFSKFGTVVDCTLKTDQATGRSRGFGFILFEDSAIVQKILADKTHSLRGRQIDCKPAQSSRPSAAGSKAEPIKKVFVGGLSPDIPEADIREHFGQYGKIEEVELPFDKMKNQRRAFCFITYETEEMVDKAVVNAKQKLGDREVDVRKATPRSEHDSGRGGRGGGMVRGAPRGGYNPAYAGYGMPAYDYSAYYGMPGYGYGYPGAYPGYNPYDYSSYYGAGQAADWSAYSGYAAAYAGQQPMAGVAPGGAAAGAYKAKRGGSTSSTNSNYHPYSR